MRNMTQYRCTSCSSVYPYDGHTFTCPKCGQFGILEIEFDYAEIKTQMTKESLAANHELSMWRYGPLLPVDTSRAGEMLKIGWTPLYEARRLPRLLNMKTLYIKDESHNPSGSTKDRASGLAVLNALEQGMHTISCSSTCNAASSLACHAARMGLTSVIFVPKRAPVGKLTQLSMYGAHVMMVDGDYKAAFQLSKEAIKKHGWYNRNAAINPILVEGKKTVALEIAEQLDFHPTDWVAISVGDGCSLAGVYKGFYDLKQLGLIDKIPRLLGVQSSGCAPFVSAWKNHEPLTETEEDTIADSIAVGIPRNPIKAMRSITYSNGAFIAISDEAILESMKLLGHYEGIFAEPAGATALGGLIKALEEGIVQRSESVTVIVTGNGLKDPKNAQKTGRPPTLVAPSLKEVDKYLKENGVK